MGLTLKQILREELNIHNQTEELKTLKLLNALQNQVAKSNEINFTNLDLIYLGNKFCSNALFHNQGTEYIQDIKKSMLQYFENLYKNIATYKNNKPLMLLIDEIHDDAEYFLKPESDYTIPNIKHMNNLVKKIIQISKDKKAEFEPKVLIDDLKNAIGGGGVINENILNSIIKVHQYCTRLRMSRGDIEDLETVKSILWNYILSLNKNFKQLNPTMRVILKELIEYAQYSLKPNKIYKPSYMGTLNKLFNGLLQAQKH